MFGAGGRIASDYLRVLDEIDEMAKPVAEQMKEGLKYQKGFNSSGKYRVRVMNRALNELNGTKNTVK